METPSQNVKTETMGADKETKQKRPDLRNLSLLEHLFMGSSYDLNGEVWSINKVSELLFQGKNRKDIEGIITPLNILEKKKTLNEVSKERLGERWKGLICVFDLEQQASWDLLESKKDRKKWPYITLGELDENGQATEWEVGVINGAGEEIDSSELKLESKYEDHFALEENDEGKRIMKLKVQ